MSDGLWTGNGSSSQLMQANATRHRLLRVNTSAVGALAADGGDISSYMSLAPEAIQAPLARTPGGVPAGSEGGPHFTMSPEAPSGWWTHGFEWAILPAASCRLDPAMAAQFDPAGLTIVVWEMVGNTFFPQGGDTPVWVSWQPFLAYQPGQILRTFDTDAASLRFQISSGITVDGSVMMAFSEL